MGPTYRPERRTNPKNKSYLQAFVEQYTGAQTDIERAALCMRRIYNPTDQNTPKRATKCTSCYVDLTFLNRSAKAFGPLKSIRTVFRSWGMPYIENISTLGSGFSKAEIFYDEDHDATVREILTREGRLLDGFDPATQP